MVKNITFWSETGHISDELAISCELSQCIPDDKNPAIEALGFKDVSQQGYRDMKLIGQFSNLEPGKQVYRQKEHHSCFNRY